ncbi:MAG: helix-turn-helix domain-containing protein [Cyanosarcina radialis HA8281-LM2]|jgi:Zn-dependent peptidase ImmA (M78 family)/DNA-binding XRE family transcriptional regulator|nr:helix-turn-helix domain-containing protein [Cyanosarcina radialis HA8281-LM2]
MIGTRIKLARKKAGYSLRDLAEAMGGKVSAQAIGKYERGEMTPSSDVLLALSKALGVTVAYLMDSQGIEITSVDFRTKASTTGKDRARVETEVIEWVERYLQIEEILELDGLQWRRPFDRLEAISSVEEAEDIANRVRDRWKLGCDPIPNMTELLEEKGLKVLIVDLPERVSGLTCLVRRRGNLADLPAIVVNQKCSLERRRLTLAHELCHRLIDPQYLSEKEEELAANRFAGAFLMPRSHLEKEVGKHRNSLGYRELISLKRIYRVSGAALLVRLRDIGIISSSALTYMFQSVARTWRTEEPEELEPKDKRGEYEQPQRFERLCYRALAEDLISLSKAAELLRARVEKVEAGLKGPRSVDANSY